MNILHRAIIRKLERLCKEKLRECQTKKHPNSEILIPYDQNSHFEFVYLKCKDCGTIYARNATEEEKYKIQNF